MGGKDITASRGSSNFFQTRNRGILGVKRRHGSIRFSHGWGGGGYLSILTSGHMEVGRGAKGVERVCSPSSRRILERIYVYAQSSNSSRSYFILQQGHRPGLKRERAFDI